MSNSIVVAMITVSGNVIVAALSFFFTKYYERKTDWQRLKIEHYTEFLTAMSGIVEQRGSSVEAHCRYADAANTIALVAPQCVIKAMMDFHDEVGTSNQDKSRERHDRLLRCLLLAIRKDIGVSKDRPDTFVFRLTGALPIEATRRKSDSLQRS